MLGAIVGDVVGSVFGSSPHRGGWDDFPLFSAESRYTGGTVMSVAVADALRRGYGRDGLHEGFIDAMHVFGNSRPRAGYGKNFARWLRERRRDAYNSYGNGSAMRVSSVGWVAGSLEEAEALAALSAATTHNHPEGIRGAQAVAGAIYLGRSGATRAAIFRYVAEHHGYDLTLPLADIRNVHSFDGTCRGSVPQAITAFLESASFEEAVRKAVWLGGDAGTQAAIVGAIAEAFYGGVPGAIGAEALRRLDEGLYENYLAWGLWLHNELGR